MKRWIALTMAAAAVAVAAVVLAGAGADPDRSPASGASGPTERVLLGVDGVSCGSCEGRIREALAEDPAVRTVSVDLSARTVTVDYAAGRTDPKALADRVTRLGYPARYLAAGSAVPPPAAGPAPSGSGCGGTCCARP